LAVQVTEQGVKIIDGHHRYYGALAAQEAGTEIPRLSVKILLALTPIALLSWSPAPRESHSPPERAAAYQRLINLRLGTGRDCEEG
jgi:hypothetical protein